MSKFSTRDLTLAAVLAAVYAALTMLLPIPQYGPVQFRLAEALTVLPFVCPAAAPGLFIGCLLANLLSPYGLLDMAVGSGATLLACLLTMRMPSRYLAPLPRCCATPFWWARPSPMPRWAWVRASGPPMP